jgi:hypothetical protein
MPDGSLNQCVEDFAVAVGSLGDCNSPCDKSLLSLFRWHARKLPLDIWSDFASVVVLEYLKSPGNRELGGAAKNELLKRAIWRAFKQLVRQAARNNRFVTQESGGLLENAPARTRTNIIQVLRTAGDRMTAIEVAAFVQLLKGESPSEIQKQLDISERTFYRVRRRVRKVVKEVLRSPE